MPVFSGQQTTHLQRTLRTTNVEYAQAPSSGGSLSELASLMNDNSSESVSQAPSQSQQQHSYRTSSGATSTRSNNSNGHHGVNVNHRNGGANLLTPRIIPSVMRAASIDSERCSAHDPQKIEKQQNRPGSPAAPAQFHNAGRRERKGQRATNTGSSRITISTTTAATNKKRSPGPFQKFRALVFGGSAANPAGSRRWQQHQHPSAKVVRWQIKTGLPSATKCKRLVGRRIRCFDSTTNHSQRFEKLRQQRPKRWLLFLPWWSTPTAQQCHERQQYRQCRQQQQQR